MSKESTHVGCTILALHIGERSHIVDISVATHGHDETRYESTVARARGLLVTSGTGTLKGGCEWVNGDLARKGFTA